MKALIYIIRKSMKNSLLELLHKPGKLILYICLILLIAVSAIASFFTTPPLQDQASMFWFTGILFAFLGMFVIMAVIKGIANGDAIFEMNDVNLLFVSPINPSKILFYGILRLTKTAFFAVFFILFQGSSLANFGVNYGGLLLTFLATMISVIVLSIVSLLLYSVTNGNAKRKTYVKAITILVFLPLIMVFGLNLLDSQNLMASLEVAIKSPAMTFIPVAGWMSAGVTAFLTGEIIKGFLFFGVTLLFGIALIAYIVLTNPDYYEDTLVATETNFEKKRLIAEGNLNAANATTNKVKVVKTGISGYGASTLLGKHLRESFRQSRFGFLSVMSFIIIISANVSSLLTKDLIITLQILMWMQVFLIGTGRGLKDTYYHYIYLIPESSFKKIIWSNMEVMVKTAIESILIFGIAGILIQQNIFIILMCIAVYTLFAFYLIGFNYFIMRFTGANISAGLLLVIYMILIIIFLLPGLVPAIIVGIAVGGNIGLIVALLILAAWELVSGLVCFLLAKGVLHNCDMPTVKPRG
ncbi:MAG: putative ABC exporter domain-containing protein [Mobilitalea sp.]